MITDTNNALAELSERLGRVIIPHPKTRIYSDLLKAYRIVAELAKVSCRIGGRGAVMSYSEVAGTIDRCRAIAEEGAK